MKLMLLSAIASLAPLAPLATIAAVAPLVASTADPARADVGPPHPLKSRYPDVVNAALETAWAAMKADLAKQYPVDEIVVRAESGPFDTVVAVAAYPKAYPGTGVKRLVIDAKTGVTYGKDGQHTFADFARAHGWLATPPDAESLVRFVNDALWDGVAILGSDKAPSTVKADGGKLVISFVRSWMPSGAGDDMVVTVGKEGPETVTSTTRK